VTRSLDQYLTRALLWIAEERLRVWPEDVDAVGEDLPKLHPESASMFGSSLSDSVLGRW
jgi:hypothetical protein